MSREVRRTREYVLYKITMDCPCGCEVGEVTCAVRVWPHVVGDAVECVSLTYPATCKLTAEQARMLRREACAETWQEYVASKRHRVLTLGRFRMATAFLGEN